MKATGTFLVLLLSAVMAWADPPALDIPKEITPNGQYARVLPKGDAVAVSYIGMDGIDPVPSDMLRDTRLFLLDTRGLTVGRYRFAAIGASKTGEQTRADFAVVIGTPPAPGPGPTPGPGPAPSPDPFNRKSDPFRGEGITPGFRVLITYDADNLAKYPDAQRQVLYSDVVRAYLRSKCLKASDGTPDWRVLDASTDLTNEDAMWQKVMKRPQKSLPWITIGTGKAGYEGPLPADVDTTLALLRKYGGA